jgi:hypothetical protein
MLLGPTADRGETALRRRGEAIDELVEPGRGKTRRRSSGEETPPGQSIGHPSTTSPSDRSRAVTRRVEPSLNVTSQLNRFPLALAHRTRRTCVAARDPCSVRG